MAAVANGLNHRWLLFALITLIASFCRAADAAELSAKDIVARAHASAGGEVWRRPRTLELEGHAVLYQQGKRIESKPYRMWRVFPDWGGGAHRANGKVRIDAMVSGQVLFQTSFDGEFSYDRNGRVDTASANREWAENFGFGIIRFALDDGYSLTRQPDDQVESHPCHVVTVTDPLNEQTTFWIDRRDYAIRKVAFVTTRGWHERIYSDFYRVTPERFMQAGRVRLYYAGLLSNDIRWTKARVNHAIADATFVLPADAGTEADTVEKAP